MEFKLKGLLTLGINANVLESSLGSSLDKRWIPKWLMHQVATENDFNWYEIHSFGLLKLTVTESESTSGLLLAGTLKKIRNEVYGSVCQQTEAYSDDWITYPWQLQN